MKKCTYCGKEYPDDALRCLIDDQILPGEAVSAPTEELAVGTPVTPLAPGARKLALTERLLQIIEVVLVCFIAFGDSVLISIYIFFGGAYSNTYGNLSWVAQGLKEASCLGLLWYLLHRRGRSFGDLGLNWSWKDIGWSIVLAIVASAAFRGIYYTEYVSGMAFVGPHGAVGDVGKMLFNGRIFFSTILFQFINPFFEELIVRAYLMTEVKRLTNSVTAAVLISVVLQTSYHFYQGGALAIADGATFLIFSIYYAKTNRIAPIILAHLYMDVGGTLAYWLRS